jgi:hypothetical protein
MAARYNRGRKTEYLVKQELEKEGYFVIRSAGSKTLVDLVAIKFKRNYWLDFDYVAKIRFVQVKFKRAKKQRGIVVHHKKDGIEYWFHYSRPR